MRITYINHSCFLVELKERLLLFDYYSEGLKEEGAVPGLPPLSAKRLYVFVSHKHRDHFDRKIFGLEEIHADTRYIFSRDVRMNERYMKRIGIPESAWDKITYMGAHEELEIDEGITVSTLESTDRGVAFLIETEGKHIYHAGDLNWWSWEGEEEARERDMERRFKREIERLCGFTIDAAFLPLDPRQEDRFYWGFDYFMRHVDVKRAWPMHFWGDDTVAERLKEMDVSEGYRERIVDLFA